MPQCSATSAAPQCHKCCSAFSATSAAVSQVPQCHQCSPLDSTVSIASRVCFFRGPNRGMARVPQCHQKCRIAVPQVPQCRQCTPVDSSVSIASYVSFFRGPNRRLARVVSPTSAPGAPTRSRASRTSAPTKDQPRVLQLRRPVWLTYAQPLQQCEPLSTVFDNILFS